jgi:hypothetical protein
MDSPFAASNTSFVMYLEPILNNYYKTYQNIITVNVIPLGPIKQLITQVSLPKLSPFKQLGPFGRPHNCTNALLRYPTGIRHPQSPDYFMTADDIPSVISYLQDNGYSIENKVTNMLFKSRVTIGGVSDTGMSGDRRMICMARYMGV